MSLLLSKNNFIPSHGTKVAWDELVESGLRVRWAVSTLLAFSLIGLSIAIILALSLR